MGKVKGKLWMAGIAAVCLSVYIAMPIFAKTVQQEPFAVYIGTDGLYLTTYTSQEKRLTAGIELKRPLISPKGGYVAYIKKGRLVVQNLKNQVETVIIQNPVSYSWAGEGVLIYSNEAQTGIFKRIIGSAEIKQYGSKAYYYYAVVCGEDNFVYANRIEIGEQKDSYCVTDQAIIQINLNNNEETVLVQGKSIQDAEGGCAPMVAGISEDGQYLYLWDRRMSGSLAADGVGFLIYHLKTGALQKVDNLHLLPYPDQFSASPLDGLDIAFVLGSGWEMYDNKELGVLNAKQGTAEVLWGKPQNIMTAQYMQDGRHILFSAGQEMEQPNFLLDYDGYEELWNHWISEPRHIYMGDTVTGGLVQVTKGKGFDFLPVKGNDGSLYFIRYENGNFNMYNTYPEGDERVVAERLNFRSTYADALYYGHYEASQILDFYFPN